MQNLVFEMDAFFTGPCTLYLSVLVQVLRNRPGTNIYSNIIPPPASSYSAVGVENGLEILVAFFLVTAHERGTLSAKGAKNL